MMDLVWERPSVSESERSLPPPFIVTRRGGAHEWGRGSRGFPPNRGVLWPNIVGSTLWGMASGVAVVLDIVLGLAEIAPAFCQSLQTAWLLLRGVPSSRRGVAAFRGSYRPGSCPGQGRSRFRGMGSWQYSGWSSAEHVLHCIAGSYSVNTTSRMAEQ